MLRDAPIALDNDFVIQKDIKVPDTAGEYAPAHALAGIVAFVTDELGGMAIDPTLDNLLLTERPNKWGRYFVTVDADVIRGTLDGYVDEPEGVWICITLPGGFKIWDQRRVVEFRQT